MQADNYLTAAMMRFIYGNNHKKYHFESNIVLWMSDVACRVQFILFNNTQLSFYSIKFKSVYDIHFQNSKHYIH